ncbi:MAG TPA: hypothetical protein VMW24_15865 [Sedimentisphaerales bacterium]|nr:hypothetical protein [Sedimentisphaerales bacterium]
MAYIDKNGVCQDDGCFRDIRERTVPRRCYTCVERELAQVKAERDDLKRRVGKRHILARMVDELRDALDCQCYHGFTCPNCELMNEAREFLVEKEVKP